MTVEKPDQRREAGRRTRERLLSAALELLAQRGQSGVTLREITDAAGANVAMGHCDHGRGAKCPRNPERLRLPSALPVYDARLSPAHAVAERHRGATTGGMPSLS